LRWLGLLKRVPEERDVKKMYKWKLIASRPVGRLKIRSKQCGLLIGILQFAEYHGFLLKASGVINVKCV
jgi:hypothetical protein